MRRRGFIRAFAGSAVAWPITSRAQQPARQPPIAIFHPAIPTTLLTETGGGSAWRASFAELRRLGYVEGENLIIERYSAEGKASVDAKKAIPSITQAAFLGMREAWEGSSGCMSSFDQAVLSRGMIRSA